MSFFGQFFGQFFGGYFGRVAPASTDTTSQPAPTAGTAASVVSTTAGGRRGGPTHGKPWPARRTPTEIRDRRDTLAISALVLFDDDY